MITTEPQRLLHISHARQDEAWVQGTLIPALGLAEGEFWTREEDDPGAPKLAALSQAVRACRYTLLVASRAAAVNAWTTFAGEIAGQLGLEEGKPRLLVLALGFAPGSEDAKEILSLEQRALACFDCRDAERTPAALAALAAVLALATRPSPPIECPYPGLRMFGEGDPQTMFQRTDLFFGRDAEARVLVDRLRASGRALVLGPSGCGKSSLVRARVLSTLTAGDHAMVLIAARPGPAPGEALRDAVDAVDRRLAAAIEAYLKDRDRSALVAAADGPARLVYLDQLEEVFAATADARTEMFAWLAALGDVPGVAILLGMRSDFFNDLMRSPAWDTFKDHRVELSPLRGAGLREAITRPAEAVGVHVEVDLVERLVREAEADRAAEALPLLQVALEKLWAQRAWRYLSLDSYARLAGDASTDVRRGLDVVFARHADATIDGFAEPVRVVAWRVLIDLVHFDDERPRTRRRRSEAELRRVGDDEAVLRAVLDRLAARRLVVVGAELTATVRHVDLAHDALITGWPALAGWIRDRRDRLVTQRRLEERAAAGGLLTRTELPEFVEWLAWAATPAGQALGASEAMRVLVRRSQAARAQVRATLVAVMVSLTAAAGVATWQWRVATRSAAIAQTARESAELLTGQSEQEAGRQLLLNGHPLQALPYLTAARRGDDASPSLRLLFHEASQSLPLHSMAHDGPVFAAAFSPDGNHIVTASNDHTARIWDSSTVSAAPVVLRHGAEVLAAVYSPDGTRIATASADGTAQIWDAVTGAQVTPPLRHDTRVQNVAFSPDSLRLVTAGWDGKAQIWDTHTGAAVGQPLQHKNIVISAVFSPDGSQVVTASADKTACVWDAATGKLLVGPLEHEQYVLYATFSPDGERVVTASADRSARIWDARTGRQVVPRLEHDDAVVKADYSPDGAFLATASYDHTARVWDAHTGKAVGAVLRHRDRVTSVAFSPDGAMLVTGSWDHTARLWNATTGLQIGDPLEHQREVLSVMVSSDGRRVLTANAGGTAELWPVGLRADRLVANSVQSVGGHARRSFTFASKYYAQEYQKRNSLLEEVLGGDVVRGQMELQYLQLQQQMQLENKAWTAVSEIMLRKHEAAKRELEGKSSVPEPASAHRATPVSGASSRKWVAEPMEGTAYSPDRRHVLAADRVGVVYVWDMTTGQPITPPLNVEGSLIGAGFSKDGTKLVTVASGGHARIWRPSSGQLLLPPLLHRDAVVDAAFSPDGTLVVTASGSAAYLWDTNFGLLLLRAFEHQDWVTSVSLNQDASRILTTSYDKTARVWDTASGMETVPPLDHSDPVLCGAFSSDGFLIVTVTRGTAWIWDVLSGKLLTSVSTGGHDVVAAEFSPDDVHVVLWDGDGSGWRWDVPQSKGSLADWSSVAARGTYTFTGGVVVPRIRVDPAGPATVTTAARAR